MIVYTLKWRAGDEREEFLLSVCATSERAQLEAEVDASDDHVCHALEWDDGGAGVWIAQRQDGPQYIIREIEVLP